MMNDSGIAVPDWNETMEDDHFITNKTVETFVYPVTLIVVYPILLGSVLIPNCLILLVIIFSRELKKTQNSAANILWLCLSDILVGIAGVMYYLTVVVEQLATHPIFCSVSMYAIYAGILQSLSQTFLICIERYLAVVKPSLFDQFNKYRYLLIFGTIIVVNVYVGCFIALYMYSEEIPFCGSKAYPNFRFFLLSMSVVTSMLLVLITGLYASTVIAFRKQMGRKVGTNLSTTKSGSGRTCTVSTVTFKHETKQKSSRSGVVHHGYTARQRREQRVLVTIGLIVLALICLSGPREAINAIEGLTSVKSSRLTKIVINLLSGTNSILNPVLYAWRLKIVRTELKEMCKLCR